MVQAAATGGALGTGLDDVDIDDVEKDDLKTPLMEVSGQAIALTSLAARTLWSWTLVHRTAETFSNRAFIASTRWVNSAT
jgi:hypothetical protein